MQKLGVVKKFLIVFSLIAMLGIGFVTMNVMTSCKAEAQVCTCGTLCTYIGMPTAALTQIMATPITSGVAIATAYLSVYYAWAMETGFGLSVAQKIYEVSNNQIDWWDTFWYYNLRPAMMDMTDQLVTMDKHQDLQMGKFNDVQNLNRTNRDMMKQEIASHRELRPGENVCQAGTISGGMNRAAVLGRTYAAAAPAAKAPRTGNAKGTAAAQGSATEQRQNWAQYVSKYCDPQENAGASGCTTAGTLAGRDIDVSGEVFQKDTIDLKDPNTKMVIDDMIQQIAEPRVREPIPEGAVTTGSAKGQEQVLIGESYKAKRQSIYDALYFVVARRAPGSKTGEFLEQLRGVAAGVSGPTAGGAGVDPAYFAPNQNPSRNEIMQVMMAERFRTGTYNVDQVDNPENNGREMVVQQAFQAMQMSDQLDLMDRYAVMLAAEVSENVRASKSLLENTDDRPTK
ncbi:MAG TPA: hypothetical protein VEF76_10060 [Patescibacteria group bacterium]|nr:hypothetical protein [Patescibacteria group bacterium]